MCCSKSILKGIVNGNVKMFVKFPIVSVRVRGLKSHCTIDRAVQAADLHVPTWRNRIHCINKQILIFNGIQLRWQVNVKLGQNWLNGGDWSSIMNRKRLINDEWRVRSVHCWCSSEIILIDRLGGRCYQWTVCHSLIDGIGESIGVHVGRCCWPTIESVIQKLANNEHCIRIIRFFKNKFWILTFEHRQSKHVSMVGPVEHHHRHHGTIVA